MTQTKQHYLILFMMLLLLVLFSWSYQWVLDWLSHDLRDGLWMCRLINNASLTDLTRADLQVAGLEGRFVWAASTFFLITTIAGVVVVSLFSIVSNLHRWRIALGLIASLYFLGFMYALLFAKTPDHINYMQLLPEAEGCGFILDEGRSFNFLRYFLLIIQPYYEPGFLDQILSLELRMPLLLFLCNLILILALLTITLSTLIRQADSRQLTRVIHSFRLLMFLASALFTAIALYHMSLYGWFAQLLGTYNPEGAADLRGLQRGVTLFIGATNSLALLIMLLPPGWILSQQAQILWERDEDKEPGTSPSTWLEDRNLKLFSGPLMKIIIVSAPLLVSGGVMLLEQALIIG